MCKFPVLVLKCGDCLVISSAIWQGVRYYQSRWPLVVSLSSVSCRWVALKFLRGIQWKFLWWVILKISFAVIQTRKLTLEYQKHQWKQSPVHQAIPTRYDETKVLLWGLVASGESGCLRIALPEPKRIETNANAFSGLYSNEWCPNPCEKRILIRASFCEPIF